MAQVKIQDIIEHLDYDLKRALEDAVIRTVPDAEFDRNQLFREFCKAVGRKTSTWVNVHDQDVNKRCNECGKNT